MADLTLKGNDLNFMGTLTLQGDSGGKILIGAAGLEALVEVTPSDPSQGMAPPVILPPPPASPLQPQPDVWIVNSFNKTVKAGSKNLVTMGMAMQGQSGSPAWPGMVLPSAGNTAVKANSIPINVKNDQAVIFPSGGSAVFSSSSGQS